MSLNSWLPPTPLPRTNLSLCDYVCVGDIVFSFVFGPVGSLLFGIRRDCTRDLYGILVNEEYSFEAS